MPATPAGLQTARDQPLPDYRLHKRGQPPFGDDVQAHFVGREPLLIAGVIEEETQCPVDPTPVFLAIAEAFLHR
jgi:hypothetical protein